MSGDLNSQRDNTDHAGEDGSAPSGGNSRLGWDATGSVSPAETGNQPAVGEKGAKSDPPEVTLTWSKEEIERAATEYTCMYPLPYDGSALMSDHWAQIVPRAIEMLEARRSGIEKGIIWWLERRRRELLESRQCTYKEPFGGKPLNRGSVDFSWALRGIYRLKEGRDNEKAFRKTLSLWIASLHGTKGDESPGDLLGEHVFSRGIGIPSGIGTTPISDRLAIECFNALKGRKRVAEQELRFFLRLYDELYSLYLLKTRIESGKKGGRPSKKKN